MARNNKKGKEKETKEELFWADQIAKQIIERKKFHYTDKKIPKLDTFTVKTSASLSGVLHIGRLSDTIRGESVVLALKDAGIKTNFIWVAEDMDPMRKIPKGVPKEYQKYLGMPVTDVPDPEGCHKSYAEHHVEEYMDVIDNFVFTKLDKFSMREEYKKGNFKSYIKKILENIEPIVEIQNRYRQNKLGKDWCPWTPICDNCGKISTPEVIKIKDGIVHYECKDYSFESTTATGCKHKGENDPLKGSGKLMWKSEWASQWARWKVVSEGAGKEYQVPNSAWWINGEIVEKVHSFPMPVPIFYEHILVDNVKMSASLGNVVYPRDWLEVSKPELLRFFYNKRLMTTRSFSWKFLPNLYDEYDKVIDIYLGNTQLDNEKEKQHKKRILELSNVKKPEPPLSLNFAHAAMVSQISTEKQDVINSLKRTDHYTKSDEKRIFHLIEKARIWLDKYAPEDMKFVFHNEVPQGVKLDNKQKAALKDLIKVLEKKKLSDKELHAEFYEICKSNKIEVKEFFEAAYLVMFNKERGPKLAAFINSIGKEKIIKLLSQI